MTLIQRFQSKDTEIMININKPIDLLHILSNKYIFSTLMPPWNLPARQKSTDVPNPSKYATGLRIK
jgi:hypothetical protein